MHGEKCGSSKIDIWAGNVTMMKALVGLGKINESTAEVICTATSSIYIMIATTDITHIRNCALNNNHNDF